MKRIIFFSLAITLLSVRVTNAAILNDSIPPGTNFEKAIFRLWYPDGLKFISGIIVLVPGSNSDGRGDVTDSFWQEFAGLHSFAILGCWFTDYKSDNMFIEKYVDVSKGSGQAMLDVIRKFSVSSVHPELAGAPLALWGMSAGGEFNYEFACWKPERVIAFVVNKGGIYYTALAPEATRSVPGIFFTGEKDLDARRDIIKGLFSMNRRAGAQWIYAPEPDAGHEVGLTRKLAAIYFNEIIPMRISNQNGKNANYALTTLSISTGYIGDHKSQSIFPVSEGNKYDYPVSWFPGNKTAEAWLGFISKKQFY
jgi:hypothetical protein